METIHAVFTLEKETKGSFRFQEIDQVTGVSLMQSGGAYKVGTLYIRKSAIDGVAPRKLVVTIAADDS